MATSSRSAERFKYGICLNDECPLCKEKKIQQIPMRKDLVCSNPECGKPLRECQPPTTGPNKKLIGIIAGAVIGLAAIGGGIYALTSGGDEDKAPVQAVVETDSISSTTDSVNTEPVVKEEQAEKTEPEKKAEKPKDNGKTSKPATPRELNLGYGTYRGDISNGQPNGYGTITYKKSHKIVSWKDYEAEPGDRFEGDFRDGTIVNGYWIKKSDGNRVFIN